MKNLILLSAVWLLCSFSSFAQHSLLQSGPMVGHVDFREAILWVQTKSRAKVQFAYWEERKESEKDSTKVYVTKKESGFTAKLIANKVQPGKQYFYQVIINDQAVKLPYPAKFKTPVLWHDSGTPPNFTIAFGSCAFINDSIYDDKPKGYGGDYQVFTSISKVEPDIMFWMGDNMYLREADWNTETGIYYRYTHTRSLPEMQPLLAATQNYAVWDDHDFGPNDSDRSFVHKDKTLKAFQDFWGNPSFGIPGVGGTTTMFTMGDVDFFLLDNRYFRSPQKRKTGEPTILGKEQLEWLIDALAFSEATFKMVLIGNLFLSTSTHYKNQNYISNFAEERTYILKRIEDEDLKNVIFLTGDKHFSELSMLTNARRNVVYDFTASPLTSKANTREDANTLRVPGTLVQERNFGLIEVSGSLEKRQLTMKVINADGKEMWEKIIVRQPD